MSIRFIALMETVTFPNRIQATAFYNASEHGRLLKVREVPTGLLFICGLTGEDGKFVENGETVDVPHHMVKWITRDGGKAEVGKGEVKK